MKKVAGLLLCLLSIPAVAALPPGVGTVKKVNAACVVRQTACLTLASGASILTGDVIQTDSGGYAGLSFEDGTTVALGENSTFEVRDYRFAPLQKQYSFDVYMKKGQALYSSGRLGKLSPASVHFRTPHAAIAVRGTRFMVTAD